MSQLLRHGPLNVTGQTRRQKASSFEHFVRHASTACSSLRERAERHVGKVVITSRAHPQNVDVNFPATRLCRAEEPRAEDNTTKGKDAHESNFSSIVTIAAPSLRKQH